jgi:hypothetical protein
VGMLLDALIMLLPQTQETPCAYNMLLGYVSYLLHKCKRLVVGVRYLCSNVLSSTCVSSVESWCSLQHPFSQLKISSTTQQGDIENASKELGHQINKMPMNKPNNNCCLGFGTNM